MRSRIGWSHCPQCSGQWGAEWGGHTVPSCPQWGGHTVPICPQLSPVVPNGMVTLFSIVPSCPQWSPAGLVLLGPAQLSVSWVVADVTPQTQGWDGGEASSPSQPVWGPKCHGSSHSWTHPKPHQICDCWAPGRAWGGLGGSVCPPGDTLTLCCVPQFGAIRVRCLFTPCHTSGHMCYFMWEDDSPDAPALFSGIPPCPRAPHGFWGHSPCVLPVGEPSTPVPQVTPCSWGAAGSSSRAQQSRCTPTSPKSWALCPRTR